MSAFLLPNEAKAYSYKEISFTLDFKTILIAISVSLTLNLVLTLLMIVKRVFKLMDNE